MIRMILFAVTSAITLSTIMAIIPVMVFVLAKILGV